MIRRFLKAIALRGAGLLLLGAAPLHGVDLNPQMEARVCNEAQTSCAGVTSSRLDVNATQVTSPWVERIEACRAVISAANTTSTPLAGNATFTGTFTDVLDYPDVSVIVYSSHISATAGLNIEWSTNGTTVHASDSYQIPATVGKQYSWGKKARYFRVRYTNGATLQTTFELQTLFHPCVSKSSSHRTADAISDNDDAELTKSLITGKDQNNAYVNGTFQGDRLKTDVQFSSTTFSAAWSSKLRYDDMNASTGGVARGSNINTSATWTNVYSYTGSGFIGGLILNLDTFTGWEIRLIVDTETVYTFVAKDLTTDTLYDVDDVTNVNFAFMGIMKGAHDTFSWHPPGTAPMRFNTSVQVQLRRPTAGAKKFQAGLMILAKET